MDEPLPQDELDQKGYRKIVAAMTVCGLVANFFMYAFLNMVSVVGGPVACVGTMLFTIIVGLFLWKLPTKKFWRTTAITALAVAIWCPGTLVVFFALDPVQAWIWKFDTERVAKEYAGGSLPPGCVVEGTLRANVHTPLECKDSVAKVAAWYRSKLGPEWVETIDDGEPTFIRQLPGRPRQTIRIYKDDVFVEGTAVLVCPTLTN